ncbi:TIGR03936 family radical SAM-associated protein [Isachenkonia alkalipeptolytica]|nr:TIGR03936 family radical SAM-associated protein [Isachenkonia alkalipeptolytica]
MAMLRGKFSKTGDMKYISHLDLVRLFHRVLRRAGINIAYTQGFNPHPIISFATALSLGVESYGEYFDLKLNEEMSFTEFQQSVNQHMPRGIKILDGKYIDSKEDSLMSMVEYSDYLIAVEFIDENWDRELFEQWVAGFLEEERIMITRKKKKKRRQRHQEYKEVDVRPLIKELTLESVRGEKWSLYTLLTTGSKGNLKPEDLIKLFEKYLKNQEQNREKENPIEITSVEITRKDLYQEVNGAMKNLIDAV